MLENGAKSGDFSKISTGEFLKRSDPVPCYQNGSSPDIQQKNWKNQGGFNSSQH